MCAAEGLCEGPARFFLLNHPSQPDRTSPNPAQMIFTAQCRSASSLDPAAFISHSFTKSPDPLNATSYPLKTLAPQQKHTRGRVYSFIWTLNRCVLLNVALHLCWINSTGFASAFVLSIRAAHEREAFTQLWCSIRQRVNLLNRFFWMIRSKRFDRRLFTQNWFKVLAVTNLFV